MANTFCTQCGQQIPDTVKFCPGCGAPVTQTQNNPGLGEAPQAQNYNAPQGYNGQPQGYNGQPGYNGPQGYNGQQRYNGQPGYPLQNAAQESKGLAIASMVIGICSIVFGWVAPLSITLGVIALVFGIVNLAKKKGGKGMAIAGVVTGAVGFIYGIEVACTYGRVFSLFGKSLF